MHSTSRGQRGSGDRWLVGLWTPRPLAGALSDVTVLPSADPLVLNAGAAQHEGMDLATAERQLQAAQRAADVESLDALLHPQVVGAGSDGTVFTKEDDLESYRSGALRITRLVEESLDVHEDGQTGMTRTIASVDAIQGGAAVSARLRYTRLWVRGDSTWRVLAATFVPV